MQPADCDAFIDRAHLFVKKNDLKSATADIGILKTKKCRFRGALDWLLLQELAVDLVAKNARQLEAAK